MGLWMGTSILPRVLLVMAIMERATCQMLVDNTMFPLNKCDFHFQGHKSVPPIFDLQNPGVNGLSPRIITRYGQALRSAATSKQCHFPGGDEEAAAEVAELCGKQFHVELDKLATKAPANITEWYMKSVKGRSVLLPLTSVDLLDGTQLRHGDGNKRFPESRRCLTFFTSSDLTSLLDRVLNKAHRKKLSKISASAQRFRYDLNSLINGILQFP